MAKKSETLSQRAKAQRDLIELKKMQAGEIEPGPKPSEEAVVPKTFKEKTANFFYHYKFAVAICAFLAVVLTVLVVNMITRVNYDSKVVVFSYNTGYSLFNTKIAEYFDTIYPDVNKNGKTDISAIDCSVNPKDTSELKTGKLTRLSAMLSVESDALIYLVDEESVKHFDNLGVSLFKEEDMVLLGQDFYDFIEVEDSG
ncbi:MAG: hypothetical protein J6V50_00280, partial [Clostridia bacterium]|nr:hypothetical protein [Clostridia bacterium]